jgi:DNA polymerase-3 subunit gamma/tau
VRLVTEIGTVTHTAHAESVAEQVRRQQLAEQTLNEDPFVQTLIREFGATIVPGSIKPV